MQLRRRSVEAGAIPARDSIFTAAQFLVAQGPAGGRRPGFASEWRHIFAAPGVLATYSLRFTDSLVRMLFIPILPLFALELISETARVNSFTGLVIGSAAAAAAVFAVVFGRLGDRDFTWTIAPSPDGKTRTVTICAKDRPGLVASMAGVFTLNSINILDVRLENMEDLWGPANRNVTLSVTTGEEGFSAWKSNLQLDAWVTYKTWSYQLQSCEFIPIEGIEGLRRTPVAVTRNARQPESARAFIRFLQSEEARVIFVKHGYE